MTTSDRAATRTGLQAILGGVAAAGIKKTAVPAPIPVTKPAPIEHAPSTTNGAPQLPISAIDPDPDQPRKAFDDEALKELAESIREIGLLQPITVRPNPNAKGRYLIMTGERRYRAAKLLELKQIPALVGSPPAQAAIREVQMIENIHREALTPMEIATYLREKIIEGRKKGEIAALIKKSPAFVSRHLALINLPPVLQEVFDSGRCSDLSVMYELRGIHKEAPEKTVEWLRRNQSELTRGSMKELDQYVTGGKGAAAENPKAPEPASPEPAARASTKPIDSERSEALSRLLGTRVTVEDKQIRISILNPEELKRIEQLLTAAARASSTNAA